MSCLEVCCDSVQAVMNAQEAGTGRVELCRDLPIGGISPSPGEIEVARRVPGIKLHVLIRPRGGDFVYSRQEMEIMKADIHYCGKLACDGVVIGVLHPDGRIDKEHTRELIAIARSYSMSVTFHRAIDESRDIFQAMEDCIELGCDRILTSGGKPSATEGIEVLAAMNRQAAGRIILLPGAGVSPANASQIVMETGCREIHGSFQGIKDKIKEALNQLNQLP